MYYTLQKSLNIKLVAKMKLYFWPVFNYRATFYCKTSRMIVQHNNLVQNIVKNTIFIFMDVEYRTNCNQIQYVDRAIVVVNE